ncbi:acyltransferase family-domain-containing protein [Podospora fimiseda]|uniref:Acyltransferase family-domain-containing protein n=1 Tax=Podospora fimiseda TaxID=252190 RepID=A0AAN7BMD0_9PEZI|nr:acyltransferase family-domain-containing protein [Podospora fimiseda]
MNGHAPLTYEEQTLLDEKRSSSSSDLDSSDISSSSSSINNDYHILPLSTPRQPPSPPIPRSLPLRTLHFLLPSFLPLCSSSSRPHKLHPTSYLDGLRGLAALFVFFCHYTYTSYVIAHGYGYIYTPPTQVDSTDPPPIHPPTSPTPNNHSLLKLPLIRLFYSGPPMVCVFFIISGYALSLKPVLLIHSRNYSSLNSTISSLVFRRAIRLFLPCAISTLFIVILVRLDLYEWTRSFAYDAKYIRNVQEIHYEKKSSFTAQLNEWAKMLFEFIHVWDWESFVGWTNIDVHLWTIPVEFRASMMLFLGLMGTSKVRVKWRYLGILGMGAFAFWSGRWEVVLFLWGWFLAEIDQTTHCKKVKGKGKGKGKGWVWGLLGWVGLYLMSQPDYGSQQTPGWIFLCRLIPSWWKQGEEYRFWQSLGSMLFVLSCGKSKGWKRCFEMRQIQYLGRISYALYLMHGPVLHTVGYAVERMVWVNLTGVETEFRYNLGFVLASLVVVPVVIWVSDFFWRGVDEPIVRFAKWVERRVSISE